MMQVREEEEGGAGVVWFTTPSRRPVLKEMWRRLFARRGLR